MVFRKIIIATFFATSVMTLFSYSLSALLNLNFREPQILSILIDRIFNQQGMLPAKIEGWVIHYLVGLFFIVIYACIWKKSKWKPSLLNGLILGSLSGVFAVLVWHLTLTLHPQPPVIEHSSFYIQLVFAHAVFGVCAAWVQKPK